MRRGMGQWVGMACVVALACGGGSSSSDTGRDVVQDGIPGGDEDPGRDVPGETVTDTGTLDDGSPGDLPGDDGAASDGIAGDGTAGDLPGDAEDVHDLPPLVLKPPLAPPVDPLAGKDVESCPIYQDTRCEGGQWQVCQVFDPATDSFVEDPDPLLRRVLLMERWRDKYGRPDGQTSEVAFNTPTPPGTPEEEWAAPERFASHEGMGDSGIWTGWTVIGDILRYSQTGTEADYQRMEQGVRTLLTMYDVTGIPGYFIRYFFLLMPDGAPNPREHLIRYESRMGRMSHHYRDVDPAALGELPAIYRDGITDDQGVTWKGRPMWQGRPSIDQNTGPMNALPMAWALLRDEGLKQRIARHLTCYLKRLQRIEIIHLQQNPALLSSLTQFFNAGELMLDPDDIDLTQTDRIVAYVQRQINTANEETFDRSCPDTIQLEPWRVIDAAGEYFVADFLELVNDMDTSAGNENQIDHYYFPSIRGGDVIHLMHLAAMAYWFTGDEQYRSFLFDELIGNLQGIRVVFTTGAFDQPKFCSHFFGDQLTYGSWWVLLGMLPDSDLKRDLQKAFYDEMYLKLLREKGNADFYVMLAGEVPDELAPERSQALAYALEQVRTMGGNGWVDGQPVLDDPRRSYTLTPDFVMARVPEGVTADCPTQREYELCTTEIDFMGIKIPGQNLMDYVPCNDEDPWQCRVPNGKCTDKMASAALPVALRQYTDWLWQRNPYQLRKGVGMEGGVQMPGADLSEVYWNARRYGFLTEGAGQVLAWQTLGTCESDAR
ncbi:MAG TPA: hypothetical protein PLQ97_13295 [Myxococcota bacterium]|nr:hypothetical protein [Myxococcota bacterium]HQK52162.1 hypothetical protein [Myxococcota bacterium]